MPRVAGDGVRKTSYSYASASISSRQSASSTTTARRSVGPAWAPGGTPPPAHIVQEREVAREEDGKERVELREREEADGAMEGNSTAKAMAESIMCSIAATLASPSCSCEVS